MQKEKCTAIVLAGGRGKRMGSKIQKQYLEIQGKPLLYYSLHAFQQSTVIDEIILVAGENQEAYCKQNIVDRFHIRKVKKIVTGGAERYDSVWKGLCAMEDEGYVFIHDGARPFLNEEIIRRSYERVQKEKACVVGMPVKDTIKIADENGFIKETPPRNAVWMVQTPQVFETALIKKAYAMFMERDDMTATDDAMVAEVMLGQKVSLVEGTYQNIKITTPEDLAIAEAFAANLLETDKNAPEKSPGKSLEKDKNAP